MLTSIVWGIIATVMADPSTGQPVFVVQEPPIMVTLEECIKQAQIVQADKTTNEVMLCMPPVPEKSA